MEKSKTTNQKSQNGIPKEKIKQLNPQEITEKSNQVFESELVDASNNVKDFTHIFYDGIKAVFGQENPNQILALNWPATVLDAKALEWNPQDTDNVLPEDVRVMASQLLDTYVPPSAITQPDGTRVSDRYKAVINQLGAKPNAQLLELQELLRKKISKKIQVHFKGKETEMTIAEWFDILYGDYITEKRKWDIEKIEEKERLKLNYPGDPNTQNNLYLEWYRINADTFLSKIDMARSVLLAEFPLREWEAALSILDTSNNALLQRAKNKVANLNIPIPIEYGGGDYAPNFGVPNNWSTNLVTNTGYLDILESPSAKYQAITNGLRALESELLSWSAIIPEIDDNTLLDLLKDFQQATNTYSQERVKLVSQYGESVYVVAEAVAAYITSFSTPQQKFVTAITNSATAPQSIVANLANAASASWGLDGNGGTATYERITELVEKLTNQQNGVWTQHEATLNAGSNLAGAATDWLNASAKKSRIQWIAPYIKQLEIRIENLRTAQVQMVQSSMMLWKKLYNPNYIHNDQNPDMDEYRLRNISDQAIPNGSEGQDITPTKDFNNVNTINEFHAQDSDDWTSIILNLSRKDMESSERLNTYFSKRNWGVNFFFGSYGKSQEYHSTSFASNYMSSESNIQIGMLVKKVVIRRNWMNPEVLNQSQDFFRSGSSPFNKPDGSITSDEIINDINVQNELHDYMLPSYPVAFLIAKDVSIKMNFAFQHSQKISDYCKEIVSSGGGFFLFNSTSASSSEDSYESVNVNVESGELEIKFKSPQIIGYYLQLTPPDKSEKLDMELTEEIINSFSFLNTVKEVHNDLITLDTNSGNSNQFLNNNNLSSVPNRSIRINQNDSTSKL